MRCPLAISVCVCVCECDLRVCVCRRITQLEPSQKPAAIISFNQDYGRFGCVDLSWVSLSPSLSLARSLTRTICPLLALISSPARSSAARKCCVKKSATPFHSCQPIISHTHTPVHLCECVLAVVLARTSIKLEIPRTHTLTHTQAFA